MGHPGIADDRPGHVPSASAPSLRNTRLSQISLDRSVGCPAAHSALKCAYSSAQVGSSCMRVTDFSGGRPLGSSRVRWTNSVGPHLQSELIWALPFSAKTSHV